MKKFKYIDFIYFRLKGIFGIKIKNSISEYENFIKQYLNLHLPNFEEKKIVTKILSLILFKMQLNFFIPQKIFFNQLALNDGENILALINMVLPYLDDKNNFHNQHNVESFMDIVYSNVQDEIENYRVNIDNNAEYCNYRYDHNDYELENDHVESIQVLKSTINAPVNQTLEYYKGK